MLRSFILTCCVLAPALRAQTTPDVRQILERLDRLEKQNQELQAEIGQLRRELLKPQSSPPEAAAGPSVPERLDVQEARTADLDQSKVGATQRMPVSLTGMVLFNAFQNTRNGGGAQDPVSAALTPGAANTGATFRQTVLGLKFDGPSLPGGGTASGSFYMDFWGGTSSPSNNLFRIRLATIDMAWKDTTVTAGQDKPIVAPREPVTLAQVGLAPLSGAGNLWQWYPQIRVAQRFSFNSDTGVRAEGGVYETNETAPAAAPAAVAATLEKARPGWEGRVNLYHGPENRRFEIAPGFHFSETHVAGVSVPSQLFTTDWLAKPFSFVQFDGALFTGRNAAGLGGLRQGFTVLSSGAIRPVHATGGWSQLTFFATPKLSFHLYGGLESDRASDLLPNGIARNLIYAGNAIYKLAPNVLAALEISQNRTAYIASGTRLNNHYDLAIAYLF